MPTIEEPSTRIPFSRKSCVSFTVSEPFNFAYKYITPLITRDAFVDLSGGPLQTGEVSGELTDRQREVVQLVAEGHPVKEIAAILSISRKTVAFHESSVMRRLGVHNTAELTRYTLEHGIIGT